MIPLFTSSQVRQADNYAFKKLGIPGIVLMENASLSIFNTIKNQFPELDKIDPIGLIAGKGNNAGDGFAVIRHFINDGFQVKVVYLAGESKLKGDALTNFNILKKLIRKYPDSTIKKYNSSADLKLLENCALILDGLLGTGAHGTLREPYSLIINELNKFDSLKVAIDLPTGLDLQTATGEIIFDADLTVTLAEYKRGLFYEKGYTYTGKVIKGSIGIGGEFFDKLNVRDYLIEPEDAYWGLPPKFLDDYKYSSGKVLVIAGSGNLPGASFFVSNSAIKIGAGAVVLAFPESIKTLAQSNVDSVIIQSYSDNGKEIFTSENIVELEKRINWADVIAIGPGLGREPETLKAVNKLFEMFHDKKFVIDADAVVALKKPNYKKVNLRDKILTPHHQEFAALLNISLKDLKSDLLKYGRKFIRETGAFLVLKGAPTIIFNNKDEIFINSSGNPGMAKFGMGDVLTGTLAGILAQSNLIESSLISGVYIHSLSADLLMGGKTIYGFTASDVLNNLPFTIKFLNDSIV